MGNPDLSLKSGILDLAIEREMHNWLHPHPPPPPPPPRSPEKSFPKSWPYGFPLYRSSRTSEKKTVKLFSWTVSFFCLLCMRVRDNCSVKNSSKSSLVSPHPPPPPAWKKRKKEKPRTGLSALKSVFRFRVVRSEFQKSKSEFPNQIRQPWSVLEVSGELPWQRLLLSLYALTHFLC